MAIGEICSRIVIFVGRNESVGEAARLMRENHIGSLVVVERGPQGPMPVGMITDRDIAVGAVAAGVDSERTPVEAVMRPGVSCVRESEGVGRAVELMRAGGVRRLPVVDASGVLVGLVAADDLIEVLAAEMQGLAGMLTRETRREREERRAAAA
ncbi:MAG TPA: CBS domain-containing protein [Usitatibacter sp.]|nr:CBS domain-containing protein [Usitatibacter sp.]